MPNPIKPKLGAQVTEPDDRKAKYCVTQREKKVTKKGTRYKKTGGVIWIRDPNPDAKLPAAIRVCLTEVFTENRDM